MSGTLFVVATPIGNLEDMTFRAVRVLREVAVVAAEDTRHSGKLLSHFGIQTPLLSLHEHNETARTRSLLGRLERGESIALVSDAGTPGVSDPGGRLVHAAVQAGFRVEPVPGASAVIAAVSAAGLRDGEFAFLGFPPVKSNDRKRFVEGVAELRQQLAVVLFEAPHRVRASLEAIGVLVKDQIVVFRELTKLHETTYRGTPGELLVSIAEPVGEFTLVIPRAVRGNSASVSVDPAVVVEMFGQITDLPARAAAKQVALETGLTPNQVYELVLRAREAGVSAPPDRESEVRRRSG